MSSTASHFPSYCQLLYIIGSLSEAVLQRRNRKPLHWFSNFRLENNVCVLCVPRTRRQTCFLWCIPSRGGRPVVAAANKLFQVVSKRHFVSKTTNRFNLKALDRGWWRRLRRDSLPGHGHYLWSAGRLGSWWAPRHQTAHYPPSAHGTLGTVYTWCKRG